MITEKEINLDNVDFCGGEYFPKLGVDEVTTSQTYLVETAKAVETKWGPRVDFIVSDTFGHKYSLSSWAFFSRKVKPTELIGKQIVLKPHNEKKIWLDF